MSTDRCTCGMDPDHCALLVAAVDAKCCGTCTHLTEQGRRLASQRDDLIAAGVNPADLLVPLASPAPAATEVGEE